MVTFQKKHHYFKMLIRPLLYCGALTYIVFHSLNGNHGVYALLKEQRKLESNIHKLESLQQTRATEERRVMLLSDQSLDLDLLDERARVVLGYAGSNEYVYLPEDKKSKN